jgi:hypothetical protein
MIKSNQGQSGARGKSMVLPKSAKRQNYSRKFKNFITSLCKIIKSQPGSIEVFGLKSIVFKNLSVAWCGFASAHDVAQELTS